MATVDTLKGFHNFGDSLPSDNIESNLVEYFNWGFLNKGAFFNVSITDDAARLRPSEDPNFVQGTVWEPNRNAIIWESGLEYSVQPISISGVYVDDVFYSSSVTGTYSHYIDYSLGRVVFNDPVSITDSVVKMEYSTKYCKFYTSDVHWFRQLTFGSLDTDDVHFLQYGSGAWNVLSQNRVQLPCVIIEATPVRDFRGYQLDGGQIMRQEARFHILTENTWDRKAIFDAISLQNEKTIYSFDKNLIRDNNDFQLTQNGSLSSGAKTYPQLIMATGDGGYFWKNIIFKNMSGRSLPNTPPLFRSVVRTNCELIMTEI